MALLSRKAISVFDEEDDMLIFLSYKDLKDYFKLTPEQLVKWKEEGESPWDSYGHFCDCYLIWRNDKNGGFVRELASMEEMEEKKVIYSFRLSRDGDHWTNIGGYYSSITPLLEYAAPEILQWVNMPDEDLKVFCARMEEDFYAKWVDPKDKKNKLYVKVDMTPIDVPYYEVP